MSRKSVLDDPRKIPPPDIADVAAIKAVANGTASADQQVRFFAFLVNTVCGYGEEQSYFGEDSASRTQYALGRRRVATYLHTYVAADMRRFKDAPREQG